MNLSKKKLLSILLIVLLIGVLSIALFACNEDTTPSPSPTDGNDDNQDEVTLIIPNGTFEKTSGTSYPLTPSDWTPAPGSTSTTVGTPNGSENLISGVISVDPTLYNKNSDKWGELANPGKQGEDDDNILMIYNKVPTVYKYTSTFQTEAGKYYKVSVPLRTLIQDGDAGKGAYIYLTGGAYAAFEKIDTANVWKTYNIYIEGSLIKAESVTITIALGYGDKDDLKLTKGYVFFDDIKADEITSADYSSAQLQNTSTKYSMRTPDSRMEYVTGTNEPGTPGGYSSKTGTGAGGSAPSYSSDITKGIVDTADWSETYGTNPNNPVEGYGNNILMIYNKNASAIGYSGNRKIRFSIGGYYKLSIDVNSKLSEGVEDNGHRGVTLILTGTDEFKIENILTDGDWVTYSFYIKSNEVRDKDFTLEMWLGQGGKDDEDTLTKGIAFFDNVTLTAITEATYNLEVQSQQADPVHYLDYVASLESENPDLIPNNNLETIDNTSGLPLGWQKETESTEVIVNPSDLEFKSISSEDLSAEEWTEELQNKYFGLTENPKAPYSTMAPVFIINNKIPTVSGMGLKDNLTIKPNLHYRMAIWLKTIGIEEGKGVDIKLVSGSGDDMETLTSFTTINTEEYENENTNDYLELVFMIQGNEITEKNLRLLIEIGSGTAYDPSNFIQGYTLIANVNMEEIKYTEYNSTSTSNYLKKQSFAESTSTVTNGNFDKLDLSETNVDADGKLTDTPGVPSSWTKSSSTEENVISGIIDTDNQDLLDALGLSNIYNNDNWTLPYPVDFGAPNLIMIKTKPAAGDFNGEVEPFGYTSSSFTLTKSSYYIVKAYAKTTGGATASILLSPTTDTNDEDDDNYMNINTNGNWAEFIFLVATGRDSVTTKVELYLGNKGSDTEVSGTVFFDSVSYQSIDEEEYTALSADESIINLSYEIETFDNYKSSSTGFGTPNNWTGTLGNSSLPNGTDNLAYGVFSKISGDASELGVVGEDDNIIEASKIDNDTMKNKIFNDTVTTIGDYVLMVNNKVPTAYSYKTSSGENLVKDSYYEISVYVYTYYLNEGKSARVMLSVGEDTFTFKDVNTSTYEEGVETTGAWTKYSYWIKTDPETATSSVYLTLGLGKYLASDTEKAQLVSGYAFFDNVNITTIDKDTFDAKQASFNLAKEDDATVEEKDFLTYNSVIVIDEPESSTPSDPTDEDGEEPEPDTTPWLLITYISTGVIGALILIVVIVVLVKRIGPKIAARRKLKFKKSSYDRNTTNTDKTTTKSSRYDKYKD